MPIIAIDPGNVQSGYCVIDFYDGRYYLAKADSEEE